MLKRTVKWLAIIMNVCLLAMTVIVLMALIGDYDMEWVQAPLILVMICTPPLNILALLPKDISTVSHQRCIERALSTLAKHQNVEVPSGLSEEVELLAKNPKSKRAAIKLHRKQAFLSRAEAKADIEAFVQPSQLTDNPTQTSKDIESCKGTT